MIDDASLLRHYVAARSEAAFAQLVDRHLPMVYRVAMRELEGDSQEAQDVAQAVFALLARKAAGLCSHPSLAGWLYRAAQFKASDARRAARRRRYHERATLVLNVRTAESQAGSDDTTTAALVQCLILELNARDREVVVLRFFETLPHAEIAQRLRLSEATVQKRVERSLDKLRRGLVRRGIVSAASVLTASLELQAASPLPAGLAASVIRQAMTGPTLFAPFTFIQLMTSTKTAVALSALAAIVVGGVSWRERRVRLETANALRSAIEARDHAAEKLQALSHLPKIAAQPVSAPAQTERLAQTGTRRGTTAELETKINHNPLIQDNIRKLIDFNNSEYFGPLLRAAGLTDAQIQRAEYLLGQTETFGGLGPVTVSSEGDSGAKQGMADELNQLLGGAGAAPLKNYLIIRQVTNVLAGSLYAGNTPLTADQATALNQILAAANQHPEIPNAYWLVPQATDWPVALQAAAKILKPEQMSALANLAMSRFGAEIK